MQPFVAPFFQLADQLWRGQMLGRLRQTNLLRHETNAAKRLVPGTKRLPSLSGEGRVMLARPVQVQRKIPPMHLRHSIQDVFRRPYLLPTPQRGALVLSSSSYGGPECLAGRFRVGVFDAVRFRRHVVLPEQMNREGSAIASANFAIYVVAQLGMNLRVIKPGVF